jgi:hypothetical protein
VIFFLHIIGALIYFFVLYWLSVNWKFAFGALA